ncbi:hypothetical protein BHE74_00008909 [Ensete ventricosum]|uniref:Uncharacterized protein n=1 Tax=Ensete ventricosum TaxID=4639 RepID=A0A426YZS2_ENSVE|nr:hypothetical protein B296_00014177 [Ensete ventricosum]RWW82613.1 hypothetical protein BHE74_00008909 [Ensete ventricosum]
MLCTSDADGGISSLRTEVWVFVPLTWSTVPDFYYSNHTHKLVAHDLFRDDVLLRLPVRGMKSLFYLVCGCSTCDSHGEGKHVRRQCLRANSGTRQSTNRSLREKISRSEVMPVLP